LKMIPAKLPHRCAYDSPHEIFVGTHATRWNCRIFHAKIAICKSIRPSQLSTGFTDDSGDAE
jgi:hypothetical protein